MKRRIRKNIIVVLAVYSQLSARICTHKFNHTKAATPFNVACYIEIRPQRACTCDCDCAVNNAYYEYHASAIA